MKGHKFICLVDSNYFHEGEFDDQTTKQIHWSDDSFMMVLTLPHENFHDNVVSLKTTDKYQTEYEYVRDINGSLFYVADYYSKMDVIKAFEQT